MLPRVLYMNESLLISNVLGITQYTGENKIAMCQKEFAKDYEHNSTVENVY